MSDPQFWLGLTTGLLAAALLVLLVALLPFLQQLQRTVTATERLLTIVERELPLILSNVRDTTTEIKDLSVGLDDGLKKVNQTATTVGTGLTVVKNQSQSLTHQGKALWVGAGAAWRTLVRKDTKKTISDPVHKNESERN